MIEALISGKMFKAATQKTSAGGKPFTTAKMRAAMGDAEPVFVNVVAFNDTAQEALLALGDGDAVAIAGTLKVGVWTDRAGVARPSLDVVAAQVLTAYSVTRKKKAMQPAPTERPKDEAWRARAQAPDFDGDLGDL